MPQAIVYRPGDSADDYNARVEGYTNRADKQQLLVVRRSREVLRNERSNIQPGDEIMVMPEVPVKDSRSPSRRAWRWGYRQWK